MPDIRAEYRIIQSEAGRADRSSRGRLRFEGPDAASFLQGLLTNDVAGLRLGEGIYAALLTPQGRMVADFRIYHRGAFLLADVAPATADSLATRLDELIFAEDVRVTDVSSATAVITVTGTKASELVGHAMGIDAGALESLRPLAQADTGPDTFVVRADESEWPMFDIWIPASQQDAVIERLEDSGIVELSADVLEVLRIEAARPAFGIDMTAETIPLEAGLLDRAISTTKGCYVGQEVIVRVLHRGGGRVAKRLVQLAFDAPEGAVSAGQPLSGLAEGPASTSAGAAADSATPREIGRITSVAFSPTAGRVLALGYVARDLAVVTTRLAAVTPNGKVAGEIVKLAG